MEKAMLFDMSKIQEIAKWENEKGVPDHLRLTQWYGDYHLYESKLNVSEMELESRYKNMKHNSDMSFLIKHVQAGSGLKEYEWIHFGNGCGVLETPNKMTVASYDFVDLARSGEREKWEKGVQNFTREAERLEADRLKALNGRRENEVIQSEYGTREEPAAHSVLDGYTWIHYSDGSGRLEDPSGTCAVHYDLTSCKMLIGGRYFNYSGQNGFGLDFVKRKAEQEAADRVLCNTIGLYESKHDLPDNVRLMKWSDSRDRYYPAPQPQTGR